uniref:Uncharacterized protein n=1 Tax=Anguilla anguilla TaxID=7936 RepID=A0A0E9WQ11_ANGAN
MFFFFSSTLVWFELGKKINVYMPRKIHLPLYSNGKTLMVYEAVKEFNCLFNCSGISSK